jgi:ABC-2 type transport system ATP-binding protein
MKQRLGIAQAIFHDPDLIFLDEPTDGVDPLGRREIRSMMQELKARGKTVFLNSHLLGEVEQVCDRVAIMNKGKLVREGDIAMLTKTANVFVIGLETGEVFPADEIRKLGCKVTMADALWEVEIPENGSIDPVLSLLHRHGLRLRHLLRKRTSLEELFLQTVEAAEPGVDVPKVKRVLPVRGVSAEERS